MLRSSALVALVMTTAAGHAAADDRLTAGVDPLDDERQVALAADVGFSGGGAATPGGLRVGGHYLYRLADHDWFDSSVAFTFGGRGDACTTAAARVLDQPAVPAAIGCERALTDGFAADVVLGVRRELTPRQGFTPFVRVAGFARALRFTDVGGFAVGGQLGAGVRAPVRGALAVVAGADAFLGAAWLDPAAAEGQLGLIVSVGAEVAMR